MRRIAVLLLLLPLVMAPKIAWDLNGVTADVVAPERIRAGQPFPVVLVVENISGVVQEDVVLRAALSVGAPGEAYTLVGNPGSCSVADNIVWCDLGDMAIGEHEVARFTATGPETGPLHVGLTRPGELD